MKKNIFYALLANLVNAGFAWLLLLYLIRFGTKSDVGLMGLAQAIALPIHMFFTLKMRTIQASDIDKIFKDQDYISSRVILSVINILITLVVAIFLYFDQLNYIIAIFALSISYSLAILREYYISILQIAEKNNLLFFSNIVQGIVGLSLFVITYKLTGSVVWALLAMSISRFPAMLFDIAFTRPFAHTKIKDSLKEFPQRKDKIILLMRKSFPLGVTAIIGALFTSIPRLILERYSGLELLGVFTTLMSLIVVVNLFMTSFVQALLPRMTNYYHNNYYIFKKVLINYFILMLFLLSIVLIFTYIFSSKILHIVFGVEYMIYGYEFFVCMVSGVFLCLFHFSNFLLNIQKNYNVQIHIYSFCALICLVSSYLLIPMYSISGAIFSTLICSACGFLICLFIFFNENRKINRAM